MRFRSHAKIFLWASAAWLLFWIAGLPDYYAQYSTSTMILFDALLLPPLVYLAWSLAARARRVRPLTVMLWLAFYVTVPLFSYDWLYCGLHLGHGLTFLRTYWYLSVYYVVPWLAFPLAGWWIERRRTVAVEERRGRAEP